MSGAAAGRRDARQAPAAQAAAPPCSPVQPPRTCEPGSGGRRTGGPTCRAGGGGRSDGRSADEACSTCWSRRWRARACRAPIWLPPLTSRRRWTSCCRGILVTPTAPGRNRRPRLAAGSRADLGIVDRPFEQRRDPLWRDLAGARGTWRWSGGPRSGKSTVLRALISSLALLHTPQAQFYVLDFGGGTLAAAAAACRTWAGGSRRRATGPPHGGRDRGAAGAAGAQFAEHGIDSIAAYRACGRAGDPRRRVRRRVPGGGRLAHAARRITRTSNRTITALAARGLGYGIHVVVGDQQVVGVPPGGCGPVRHPARAAARRPVRVRDRPGRGRERARGAPGRGLTRDGLHFLAALPRIDGSTAAGLAEGVPSWSRRRRRPGRARAPPVRHAARAGPRRRAARPATTGPGAVRHRRGRAGAGVPRFRGRPAFPDLRRHRVRQVQPAAAARAGIADPVHAGAGQRSSSSTTGARCWTRSETGHQIGYATSSVAAAALLERCARSPAGTRLPPPDLTAAQLVPDWWTRPGPVRRSSTTTTWSRAGDNPLLALADTCRRARDVGLHLSWPVGRRGRTGDVRAGHPAPAGDGLPRAASCPAAKTKGTSSGSSPRRSRPAVATSPPAAPTRCSSKPPSPLLLKLPACDLASGGARVGRAPDPAVWQLARTPAATPPGPRPTGGALFAASPVPCAR